MSKKIQIIKAEHFNWYKVGDILELAPEQNHVTLGVQVIKPEGEISDIVIHGNYKDYVEVDLESTTEEIIFNILLTFNKKTSKETVLEYLNSCINPLWTTDNPPLEWNIEEKNVLKTNSVQETIYLCQTFKDSHFHLNTNLWLQNCIDMCRLLLQKIESAELKAYCTPITLYNFSKK